MNAENSPTLDLQTVADVVRLLGSVAAHEGSLVEKKRVLMRGLGELVDADGWLWTANCVLVDEARPVSVGVMHEGFTEAEFNGLVEASQLGNPPPPEDRPLVALFREGRHYTRTRQQLVDDQAWYGHPTVRRYRLDRGIDHFLYSVYPIDIALCSALGFFRRVGRQPFGDLQRRVCHVVTANVEWIHRATFPEHQGLAVSELTPRQRTVLVYLLDGKTKQEIGAILDLSAPTMGQHISSVYRHFGVTSQVQLLRRFQSGDARMPGKTPASNHTRV